MKEKQKKSYEELTFADDFIFCKVLSNYPELCKELLELILNIRIQGLKKIDKQYSVELTSDAKGVRLDVYVEDDEDSVYDIEMQTTMKKNLPKRTRYYQGMVDMDLLERGGKYEALKKSFIIFICLEDPFDEGKARYTVQNKCKEDNQMTFKDDTIKVFLNAAGRNDDISEELAQFSRYLKTGEICNPFVLKIEKAVCDARKSKRWRNEYMSLQLRLYEEREEGREEGQNLFACLMRCLREQKREDIIAQVLDDTSLVPYYCDLYKIEDMMNN